VKTEDLEIKDIDGYTPIHLAIKSAENLKSTRPVRVLLYRGASRDSVDKNG
jgi:ankyrin repeat protein